MVTIVVVSGPYFFLRASFSLLFSYFSLIGTLTSMFTFPVISTWDVSKPSVAKTSDRDLIKTNVLAIHHGNITAKDTRLFAQVTCDG